MKNMSGHRGRLSRLCGAALVALTLSAAPALSQDAIEKDADAILHAMADQLKGLKSFSVDYDTEHEILDKQGQKLQYSASGSISVDRGAGFLITRKGPFADAEVRFDGKQISLYGKKLNVYAQIDSPGPSIDEAIEEFRWSTGLDAAGADLLAADPYAALTENVEQGVHVGTGYVGGVECDHLAFRNEKVDWQIWIGREGMKLPMKYVITTKWVTGAPQYSVRFTNWNTGAVDTKAFAFVPPEGAKKLAEIHADEIGDLSMETVE
jgi:hypothetical protein